MGCTIVAPGSTTGGFREGGGGGGSIKVAPSLSSGNSLGELSPLAGTRRPPPGSCPRPCLGFKSSIGTIRTQTHPYHRLRASCPGPTAPVYTELALSGG